MPSDDAATLWATIALGSGGFTKLYKTLEEAEHPAKANCKYRIHL